MEDYNKIIESLNVKFAKAKNIGIAQSVIVNNFYDITNTVILLNKGEIIFGEEDTKISDGDILFIPSGAALKMNYGKNATQKVNNEELLGNLNTFFSYDDNVEQIENFSYITLDAKIFDSVNFFQTLDIHPFVIPKHLKLAKIIKELITEHQSEILGKERMVSLLADQLVVEIIRYIFKKNLFVEQIATNTTYFKDPRLLDVFEYIKDNLAGDLSNKNLSKIANVSEDYVGQYFKMLTGINPQDYIEYQRMEKAVSLLRTSKRSIREIGHDVGYKDTAYFCRRFKMMFGIPAGKMRKRESLMNL